MSFAIAFNSVNALCGCKVVFAPCLYNASKCSISTVSTDCQSAEASLTENRIPELFATLMIDTGSVQCVDLYRCVNRAQETCLNY